MQQPIDVISRRSSPRWMVGTVEENTRWRSARTHSATPRPGLRRRRSSPSAIVEQHATFGYRPDLFDKRTLIHINISRTEIDKAYWADTRPGTDEVTLRALLAALNRRSSAGPPIMAVIREKELLRESPEHPSGQARPDMGVAPRAASCRRRRFICLVGISSSSVEGQNFRSPARSAIAHVNGAIAEAGAPRTAPWSGCGDGCYSLSGFELMTAVEHNLPIVWVIFNDGEFKLIKLFQLQAFQETGLVEFQNPDFAAYARACRADGYTVETIEDFEKAYAAALASGRPSVIDAKITRLALPHYSPSPKGTIAGVLEMLEARLRGGQATGNEGKP